MAGFPNGTPCSAEIAFTSDAAGHNGVYISPPKPFTSQTAPQNVSVPVTAPSGLGTYYPWAFITVFGQVFGPYTLGQTITVVASIPITFSVIVATALMAEYNFSTLKYGNYAPVTIVNNVATFSNVAGGGNLTFPDGTVVPGFTAADGVIYTLADYAGYGLIIKPWAHNLPVTPGSLTLQLPDFDGNNIEYIIGFRGTPTQPAFYWYNHWVVINYPTMWYYTYQLYFQIYNSATGDMLYAASWTPLTPYPGDLYTWDPIGLKFVK